MFGKSEFKLQEARQALTFLKGRYTFPADANIAEVNDTLEKVRYSLNAYGDGASFVLNRVIYSELDNEAALHHASFSVRPSSSYKIDSLDTSKKFVLTAGADFYDKFLDEMITWLDEYNHVSKLQANLDELNELVADIVEERGENFKLLFTVGNGLLDATDKYALIGLSEDIVMSLGFVKPDVGNEEMSQRMQSGYRNLIGDAIAQVNRPYELLKVDSNFTRDLKIYNRKSIRKLIRGFVKRKSTHVRTGIGYFENEHFFAVIDKVAITEEQASTLGEGVLVIDNEHATKKDLENNLTKIAMYYRVSPFAKAKDFDGELDVTLADAANGVGHMNYVHKEAN